MVSLEVFSCGRAHTTCRCWQVPPCSTEVKHNIGQNSASKLKVDNKILQSLFLKGFGAFVK